MSTPRATFRLTDADLADLAVVAAHLKLDRTAALRVLIKRGRQQVDALAARPLHAVPKVNTRG